MAVEMKEYVAPPTPVAPRPAEEQTLTRPHVSTEGFSVFYGANKAVADVTLSVPFGRVTAVIGPSGCGKSTLLRAVNRMNDLIPNCSTWCSRTCTARASMLRRCGDAWAWSFRSPTRFRSPSLTTSRTDRGFTAFAARPI